MAPVQYAGFWRRFAAYLIDGVILNVVQLVLVALAGLAGSVLSYIIGIAYFIGFWTWRGQTPGKMALGLKIVKTDGRPIGFGTAVLRYIGYIVSTIILGIGYLMIAWDPKKQGLHDKIAHTYVVRTTIKAG